MSDFEQNYIPLNHTSPRTRIILQLPESVSTHDIRFDLERAKTLLRIGGIGHLRVVGKTDGEISRPVPTYEGQQDSEIVVPEFTATSEKMERLSVTGFRELPSVASWERAEIDINIKEMEQRIRREYQGSQRVFSAEVWAHHLDDVIRKGITDIAIRRLLGSALGDATFMYSVWGAIQMYNEASTLAAIINFFGVSTIGNLISWFRSRDALQNESINSRPHGYQYNGFRFSLFYGMQPDRALLLKLLSMRSGLVRDFSPNLFNDTDGDLDSIESAAR